MIFHSQDEQKKLRDMHGVKKQPPAEQRIATFVQESGEALTVDIVGIDEQEQIALLSHEENGQRQIWIARRDQAGTPGTWHWTDEQLTAQKNVEERAYFRGDKEANMPIQVGPIHKDRRIEILMLGLQLNKTDEEVQQRLRAEQLDDRLPKNYRTEQGELDLLKHWRR